MRRAPSKLISLIAAGNVIALLLLGLIMGSARASQTSDDVRFDAAKRDAGALSLLGNDVVNWVHGDTNEWLKVGERRDGQDLRLVVPFDLNESAEELLATAEKITLEISVAEHSYREERRLVVAGLNEHLSGDIESGYRANGTELASNLLQGSGNGLGRFEIDITDWAKDQAGSGGITFRIMNARPSQIDLKRVYHIVGTADNSNPAYRPHLVITPGTVAPAPTTTTTTVEPVTTTVAPAPTTTTTTAVDGTTDSGTASSGGKGAPLECSSIREVSTSDDVDSPLTPEISGMAASRTNPGVYWIHNDSGDEPRIFAVNADGKLLATITINGVVNNDWEDIAVGPGPGGQSYVYIADIGDNRTRRPRFKIIRFPEPAVRANQAYTTFSVDQQSQRFNYSVNGKDAATDAEAFMVDPLTGDMIIVDKRLRTLRGEPNRARIYTAPQSEFDVSGEGTFTFVSMITGWVSSASQVGPTAADISPDGRTIIVKNYYEAFMWTRQPGQSVADVFEAATEAPCQPPIEKGEAVAFDADGQGYKTMKEGSYNPVVSFRAK